MALLLANSAAVRHNNSTMDTLLVATQNRHKAAEIGALLGDLPVTIRTLGDIDPAWDIPETGTTFRENARQKAVTAAARSGLITLADDSGLAVDALGGEPGVYSKRFAPTDAERNAKLLALLGDRSPAQRTARFHCAVVIAGPQGVLAEIEETVEGIITDAPRGENGFGYDPVFQPVGFDRTMAEMTAAEKNAISHRGKAFRKAAEWLRSHPAL